MIKVKIQLGIKEIPLPPIQYGHCGSFTDFKSGSPEIIIVECLADRGELWIQKSGAMIQLVSIAAHTDRGTLEQKFTGTLKRNYISAYGSAILILNFEPEIIN